MCHDAKVFTRKTLFDPALAAVTCLQGLFAHFWSVSRAGPLNEHTCCHDNRQGHTSCPDNISRPVRHPHWPAVTLRLPIILRLESLCMTSPIQCLYWRLTLIDAWRLIMTRIDAWSLTPLSSRLPRGPFSFFPLIWRLEQEHMPSQQSLMRSLSWTLYQPNRPFTMVMTRSTKAALLLTVRTSRRPPWWRLVCVITNFMMSSIAPWRKSATSFRIFRPSSGVFRPPSPSPSRLWHQSPLSNPDVFLDTTITQKICIWQSPIVLTRATLSLCDRTVVYLNGAYKLLNGMMKRLYVPWY